MVRSLVVKGAAVCAVIIGAVQADVIHQTTKWQSLGIETIADGASTNSNNGVSFSIDGGTTWEFLGAHQEFELGQTVDFKVEVYKEFQGTHLSDVAKVWVDGIEEGKGEWALATNGNSKTVWGVNSPYYDGNVINGSQTAGLGNDLIGSIYFDYTFDQERDYELIARAMCSDDLSKLNTVDGNRVTYATKIYDNNSYKYRQAIQLPSAADWAAFTSTNPVSTLQGEVEKYAIHVKTTNVPEPAMLSLLGCSLLGLALIRRKK